jgi:hypothetical protein
MLARNWSGSVRTAAPAISSQLWHFGNSLTGCRYEGAGAKTTAGIERPACRVRAGSFKRRSRQQQARPCPLFHRRRKWIQVRAGEGGARPTGKSPRSPELGPVKASLKKYSAFQKWKSPLYPCRSCPTERGARDRHDAGQDAMDVDGAEDVRHRKRTAKSYGPDTSKVGVKLAQVRQRRCQQSPITGETTKQP